MQKFFLQQSLTRGDIGLSEAEAASVRDNIVAASLQLALESAPTNGSAGFKQKETVTISGTAVGTGVIAVSFNSLVFSKTWLVNITHGATNAAVATAVFAVVSADSAFISSFGVTKPTSTTLAAERLIATVHDDSYNWVISGPGSTTAGITGNSVNTTSGVAPVLGTVGAPGQIAVVNNAENDTYVRVGSATEPNQWVKVAKNGDDPTFKSVNFKFGAFTTNLSNTDSTANHEHYLPDID